MAIDLDPKNELQWVKEGRVFQTAHGALTTPQAFETDLVVTTPDFLVTVPAGIVIVPLRITVETEATTNVFQCLIRCADNDVGLSGSTEVYPVNVNTRYAAMRPKCRAGILSAGAHTTPTNTADLHRVYVKPDIDAITGSATFTQVVYAPLHGKGIPTVIGSNGSVNSLLVYVGESTGTGYIEGAWAEFTYDEFYAA